MGHQLLRLARQYSDEDWALLDSLSNAGAATVMQLEVRLRKTPGSVYPRLKEFREQGLVEVKRIDDGPDNELFWISDRGLKALRLVHSF